MECGVVLAYEHEELLFEEQVARNPKTIPSNLITAKLKSNSVVLRVDPSIMQRKVEDSYWMTSDGPTSNQWLRPEDWRSHSMQRVGALDSSNQKSFLSRYFPVACHVVLNVLLNIRNLVLQRMGGL